MEFSVYRFGDFCKMFAGGDAPKDYMLSRTKEKCYPVYSNGIENEGLYGYCDCYTMPGNTLTISARGTVGVVFYRCEPFLPIVRLIALVVDEKIADTRYIYYLLKCGRIDGYGTSQQQITIPYLKKKRIQIITSLDKQKKIASILSAYDNLIEVNNKRIKVLEQMAENLYKEWFVRFRFPGHETAEFENGIPKGWEYCTIESLSGIVQRGISPEYDDEGLYTVISQKCIRQSIMDIRESRKQTKPFKQELNLADGDTIICSTGTGTLGRVGQVYGSFQNTTFDSHVTLVRAKASIGKNYLFWTLKEMQPWFMNMGIGSTNQQELYRGTIKNAKALRPNPCLIKQFERIIEPIHSSIVSIMEVLENLVKQRDLLLPRLMSGKLEV